MKKEKFKECDLTQEFLKECFTYHEDGYLVWNTRPMHHFSTSSNYKRFNTPNAGKIAGYFNIRTDSKREGFGYWRVGISSDGKLGHFKLHRLIWLYHKGYLPEVVDHEDTDTNNNKISNLREATYKTNSYNENTPVNNKSGYKGVSVSSAYARRKSPYRVSIEYCGYMFSGGSYSDPEYAGAVYNYIAKRLFKNFSKLNEVSYTDGDIQLKGAFLSETLPSILDNTFDWESKRKRTRPEGYRK